jgi:hypothetical protein
MRLHYVIVNEHDGDHHVIFFSCKEKMQTFLVASNDDETYPSNSYVDLNVVNDIAHDPDEGSEYWTKYPNSRHIDPTWDDDDR